MSGRRPSLGIWAICSAVLLFAGVLSAAGAEHSGPLLLADDSAAPSIHIAWTKGDGTRVEIDRDLPLTSTDDRTDIGRNLEAFVALGGSRLERGAGHPDGAIVRVGLVKTDRDLLFFEDIALGSSVEMRLRNVRFNQGVLPDPDTLLQRLRYKVDDVLACGLTIDQTEMFNLASEDDDMGGSIQPGQARYASLRVAGASTGDGADSAGEISGVAHATVWVEPDGSVSMDAVLPYRLLRHKGDPWALEVPGSFFEPFHFDVEFQVLPTEIAELEGIEPTSPPTPAKAEGE